MIDRVLYAQSVHDQNEIDAVVRVLTGGPTAMRPGPNVAEMERQVAALFGKPLGLMCNSARRRSTSQSNYSIFPPDPR